MNEVLRGDAFDAFLDEVIATARADEDDDSPDNPESAESAAQRQAAARELLGSRTLEPDDFDGLRRLYHVWVWLDRPADALAALDAHEARLAAALDERARSDMQRECAFMRFDTAAARMSDPADDADQHGVHAAELRARFDAVADAIVASARGPHAEGIGREGWERLLSQSRHHGLAYGVERSGRELHALLVRNPERQHWRAWDDACLQLRLGMAAGIQGDAAQAREHGLKAYMLLAQPAPGQQIDLSDWLRLSPEFVQSAPDVMDLVAAKARDALGPDAGPANFRDLEVQLARWLAQAKWKLGAHDRALELGRQGHHLLTGDEDDSFGAQLLDWLLERGQEAEAASLALESAWNGRSPSGQRAVVVAAERLAADGVPPATTEAWSLVLAAAAMEEHLTGKVAEVLGRPCDDGLVAELVERAGAVNPGNAATAVLAGQRLARLGQAEQALPLLERLLEAPQLANNYVAMDLWLTRMRVLGPHKALQAPFVEAGSGQWCYALGVNLSEPDEVMDQLELAADQRGAFPRNELKAIATRYYESAIARFEAFFATGRGNIRDGDIHTYSMNCNNLGIAYRVGHQRPADALVLHQKGLQSSPFAEHKMGVMWCHYALDQHAEFLDAAEQLWHYSLDYGFSRHNPSNYFDEVAWALQKVDRHAEIDIWLDRLQQWQRSLSPDERQEQDPDLLALQASMLDYLQPQRPEDALARMRAISADMMARGNFYGLRRLGDGLLASNQAQEALATYERALAIYDPAEYNASTLERARKGAERARQALRAQAPWWRRWL